MGSVDWRRIMGRMRQGKEFGTIPDNVVSDNAVANYDTYLTLILARTGIFKMLLKVTF